MEQLLYWLVGAIGVPVINYLKERLGWSGKAAVWLTALVSLFLGCAALLLNRELGAVDFLDPLQLAAAFGQVMTAATLAYKLLTE